MSVIRKMFGMIWDVFLVLLYIYVKTMICKDVFTSYNDLIFWTFLYTGDTVCPESVFRMGTLVLWHSVLFVIFDAYEGQKQSNMKTLVFVRTCRRKNAIWNIFYRCVIKSGFSVMIVFLSILIYGSIVRIGGSIFSKNVILLCTCVFMFVAGNKLLSFLVKKEYCFFGTVFSVLVCNSLLFKRPDSVTLTCMLGYIILCLFAMGLLYVVLEKIMIGKDVLYGKNDI